jgi:hypothetical protein
MISHKHKFIFIHIPKTGGTSVEYVLLKLHGIEISLEEFLPLEALSQADKKYYMCGGGGSLQHSPIGSFSPKLQKEYFCFSFVRNPWELYVSEFRYAKKSRKNIKSFRQFIKDPIMNPYHGLPQLSFLNKNINFIGKFENLQEDFDTICDKIGIPKQQLPHANKTKHKYYTEYYDDETRAIIAEKYAKDIEYFGYEFGE